MSETIETAFAEYQQELGVRPGTFVAYDVSNARIADLTDGRAMRMEDMLGPWKEAAFVVGADPVTWRFTDTVRPIVDGLRVPSSRYVGGVDLVLWRWNAADGPKVEVLDPNRELPGGSATFVG
jgi:RES domain-containing protein